MKLLSHRTERAIRIHTYGLLNGGLPRVSDLKNELDKNLVSIRQMAAWTRG
jgi:hypothetical protein